MPTQQPLNQTVHWSNSPWFWGVWLAGTACFVIWLTFAIRHAQESARRSACEGRLNQLHLALTNYHEVYGSFPPAYVADASGQPMHSWRVLILPYIGSEDLYKQYDFNEPWDGPNNRKLAEKYRFLHCPSSPSSVDPLLTNYVVVTGEQTAFPYDRTTRMSDFTDGLENTILLVEIQNSDIHWMEPRDLDWRTMSFQVNDPRLPSISGPHPAGPVVVFGDRIHGFRLSSTLKPETLKALLTIAGGEPVTKNSLEVFSQQDGRQLAE